MATGSQQHKLDRVRKPRVHLTYDVEIGNAKKQKELPFVVGVLADLSGQPKEKLPRLKDREFTEIDRDNFNQVLERAKPRLVFQTENRLQENESKMKVELEFSRMEDFEPEQVVKQVKPLKELLEARDRLKSLIARMDVNDRLEELLEEVVQNTDDMKRLAQEAGRSQADSTDPETEPATNDSEAE